MNDRAELKDFADIAQRAGFEVADAYTENRDYAFDEVAYIDFAQAATPAVVLSLIAENERLQSHTDEMAKMREAHGFKSWAAVLVEIEALREVMSCVVNEIPRHTNRNGNAPGHCHTIPGIWNCDNGVKAGTECGWCKVWNAAVAMSTESAHD